MTMVAVTETAAELLGMLIQDLLVYLYSYNGLVMSTQLERLQRVFDVLADLFDQVIIQKNTSKRLIMAY